MQWAKIQIALIRYPIRLKRRIKEKAIQLRRSNGKVYNESEKFTEDFRISLTLIDLDKLKFFANSNNLNNAEELKNFIQASTLKNSSQAISINGFR